MEPKNFTITVKNREGNKHIYFIDKNTRLKLKRQIQDKRGKYIENRIEKLDGNTVYYALNNYVYENRSGILTNYKKSDLIYDIKMGRLEFIFPEDDESYDDFSEEKLKKRLRNMDEKFEILFNKIKEIEQRYKMSTCPVVVYGITE